MIWLHCPCANDLVALRMRTSGGDIVSCITSSLNADETLYKDRQWQRRLRRFWNCSQLNKAALSTSQSQIQVCFFFLQNDEKVEILRLAFRGLSSLVIMCSMVPHSGQPATGSYQVMRPQDGALSCWGHRRDMWGFWLRPPRLTAGFFTSYPPEIGPHGVRPEVSRSPFHTPRRAQRDVERSIRH